MSDRVFIQTWKSGFRAAASAASVMLLLAGAPISINAKASPNQGAAAPFAAGASAPSGEFIGAITAAAIGLVGVAATLISNARQSRRRDRNSLRIFRAALVTQLDQMIKNIDDEIKWSKDRDSTLITILDYFESYRLNDRKIGELGEDEARYFMEIYYKYQDTIARTIGNIGNIGKPIVWGASYLINLNDEGTKNDYIKDLKDLLTPAKRARYALGKALGGDWRREEPEVPSDPDGSRAVSHSPLPTP